VSNSEDAVRFFFATNGVNEHLFTVFLQLFLALTLLLRINASFGVVVSLLLSEGSGRKPALLITSQLSLPTWGSATHLMRKPT